MSLENKMTLDVYDATAHMYLSNSKIHDEMDIEKAKKKKEKLQSFIQNFLKGFIPGARVLELGSGDGSNAEYIESLGYNVTASDIADDFINAIKARGVNTIKLNVLEDTIPNKYSAVFCWRVFVHFTEEDVLQTLKKIYSALEDNGVFVFNVINRECKEVDEEWVDFEGEYHIGMERYYHYFSDETINKLVNKTGFYIESMRTEGGKEGKKWLVYVLRK